MIRDTSLEAYQRIKAEGLLSEKRMAAFEVLFHHGPATAMELRKHFPKNHVDSQIRARLGELRTLGVAYERGVKVCSVTGMNVIEWEVTKNIPMKPDKPKRKRIKCNGCNGRGFVYQNIPSPQSQQMDITEYLEKNTTRDVSDPQGPMI